MKKIEKKSFYKITEIKMKKVAKLFGSVIGSDTEFELFLGTQVGEHDTLLKTLGKITKTSKCVFL